MAMDAKLEIGGLWRDPNPHSKAPVGAMRHAREVCFRAEGTCEPRPGFSRGTSFDSESGEEFHEQFGEDVTAALLPNRSDVMVIRADDINDSGEYHAYHSDGTEVLDEGASALVWPEGGNDYVRACVARQNLYLTTDRVRKLALADDAEAPIASILPAFVLLVSSGGAGTALADQFSVALRAVIRRRDANGLEVRSAPSARVVMQNNTGGTINLNVDVVLHESGLIREGDVLELYRTKATAIAVIPGDNMILTHEHTINATDVSDLSVPLTDITTNAGLSGRALYTNPNREGIERANSDPPQCKDLALFNASLFGANLAYPPQMYLRRTDSGAITTSTGIGSRSYTGTRTLNSNQITGLSSIVGLKVGMLITATTWNGTGVVRITAVGGTTATMNETWSGATDGAPVAIIFYDAIKVDGAYYPADWTHHIALYMAGVTANSLRVTRNDEVFGYLDGTSHVWNSGSLVTGERRAVLLRSMGPHLQSFAVWATHGDEYEPELPEISVATGLDATIDVWPNGVTWSKANQPEHFFPGNAGLRFIGNESPILRIFATTDALFVLKGKGDGIYRLTGFGERTGWEDKQIDSTVYLLHPSLACQVGDKIYAWTNVGPAVIGAGGIVPIGHSPLHRDTKTLERLLNHETNTPGAFAVANDKDGDVIFGLPHLTDSGEWDGAARSVFVFNTRHVKWCEWFYGSANWSCAVLHPTLRMLYMGSALDNYLRHERTITDTITDASDGAFPAGSLLNGDAMQLLSGLITGVTSIGFTIDASDLDPVPTVGDLVIAEQGGAAEQVGIIAAADTDGDSVTVEICGFVGLPDMYIFLVSAFESYLEWLPHTLGGPGTEKRFSHLAHHFEAINGICSYTAGTESSRDIEASMSYELDAPRTFDTDNQHDQRVLLPRGAGIGTRLTPSITIKQADARWRLSGLTLYGQPINDRVSR